MISLGSVTSCLCKVSCDPFSRYLDFSIISGWVDSTLVFTSAVAVHYISCVPSNIPSLPTLNSIILHHQPGRRIYWSCQCTVSAASVLDSELYIYVYIFQYSRQPTFCFLRKKTYMELQAYCLSGGFNVNWTGCSKLFSIVTILPFHQPLSSVPIDPNSADILPISHA